MLSILSAGFEKIDLKLIYFQHSDATYRNNFNSMLHFLNVISTDMVCFANAISSEKNRDLHDIIKFVIINAFKISKVKDLPSLKGVLFDKMLNYEISIEKVSNGGSSLD